MRGGEHYFFSFADIYVMMDVNAPLGEMCECILTVQSRVGVRKKCEDGRVI